MKAPRIRTGKAKATGKPPRKAAKAKPTRAQIARVGKMRGRLAF